MALRGRIFSEPGRPGTGEFGARRHPVAGPMRIEAPAPEPGTSKAGPGHKGDPYLLRYPFDRGATTLRSIVIPCTIDIHARSTSMRANHSAEFLTPHTRNIPMANVFEEKATVEQWDEDYYQPIALNFTTGRLPICSA